MLDHCYLWELVYCVISRIWICLCWTQYCWETEFLGAPRVFYLQPWYLQTLLLIKELTIHQIMHDNEALGTYWAFTSFISLFWYSLPIDSKQSQSKPYQKFIKLKIKIFIRNANRINNLSFNKWSWKCWNAWLQNLHLSRQCNIDLSINKEFLE